MSHVYSKTGWVLLVCGKRLVGHVIWAEHDVLKCCEEQIHVGINCSHETLQKEIEKICQLRLGIIDTPKDVLQAKPYQPNEK